MGCEVRCVVDFLVFLVLYPLISIGFIAGLLWEALKTGFWVAGKYVEEALERNR